MTGDVGRPFSNLVLRVALPHNKKLHPQIVGVDDDRINVGKDKYQQWCSLSQDGQHLLPQVSAR